ncbi:site-specific integrase [Rossellomorea sp. NPDC071047]|uniref:Tyrosine-type recombinase/integrase n=1 Tax=Rossellomorea vietnamensis TaxID=218284 RepID=A0A6I6ULJ9_9BACI|nr:site-specific integrase [Rossellomorea vietnamensis]QHE63974.1 tyrosine-type recombinase/integrase [Rossellomorea vietnamensis]
MNIVQPIRDKETLIEIKEYLKESSHRNYILFSIGINTGLRISDILNLKVRDVEGWYITIRTKKRNKPVRIKMPKILKKELREYIEDKPRHEYLIRSRKGKNKPITRSMAYKILNQVAREFALESIGCHSLRKTYGYMFYKQFKDVAALQEMFNHADPKYTLRYIGINQDNLDSMMSKFGL